MSTNIPTVQWAFASDKVQVMTPVSELKEATERTERALSDKHIDAWTLRIVAISVLSTATGVDISPYSDLMESKWTDLEREQAKCAHRYSLWVQYMPDDKIVPVAFRHAVILGLPIPPERLAFYSEGDGDSE